MSFEVAGEAYDRYMGAWSRLLAPGFADFTGIRGRGRALDVGCGTGALTEVLADRLGPRAVAAVDPSDSFVAAARQRLPGVEVVRAGAADLPYPDRTFDAALAQLVVHFMTDPGAGLAEMARVVRPGGVVSACVWDFAGGRGPLGPFWEAARRLDPGATDESRLPGTRAGSLTDLLAEAGLREVEETAIEAARDYASFDAWWQPFLEGVGPGGAYVAGLDPAARERLEVRCRAELPDGAFVLTAHAWAARGIV